MNLPATDIQNLSLSLTREFNAPREKVFQAWTDPKMLTQWMGPKQVDTTAAEVDLKIGGKYRFTMQESDGKQHSPWGNTARLIRLPSLSLPGSWTAKAAPAARAYPPKPWSLSTSKTWAGPPGSP